MAESLRAVPAGAGRKVLAAIAILFGLLTIFAGTRVLRGADPGYIVFRPLLVYNTVMGFAYIGVGVTIWRHLEHGRAGAVVIFLLNLLVLVAIGILYLSGGAVALQSLGAMTFRAGAWLLLFLALRSLARRGKRS